MSLFNNSKKKDKKKGTQPANKSTFASPKGGKSNTKAAAKSTRITGRAQRGA